MVMTGAHKRDAAQRLLSAGRFTADWPATIVHECRQPRILLDAAAAPASAHAAG
jgi:glucosamine-6-phosphate deaminase